MKRKIYDKLVEWKKQANGACALLVEGARRVGKSYIVKEFARREYRDYVLIDFSMVDAHVKYVFQEYLGNLDRFFEQLSIALERSFHVRETLFVFDEVQSYPLARQAIKHLVADGRYDYIETGSLLSIRENVKDILIPSEERSIRLNPMDFEEFLWANGNEKLMDFIRERYEAKCALGPIHDQAMDYFRKYLVVGGMPQAVDAYVRTKDLGTVDREKRAILQLYREDIRKHAGRYALKVEQLFDAIPEQLSKHEKKFSYSSLGKSARYREYEDAVMWLDDGRIVNLCFNTTEPDVGLRMNLDRVTMKCYLADTGLLVSHAFDENELAAESIHRRLIFDRIEINEGMLVENIVAQMLQAAGRKLYFHSEYDKSDAKNRMEIDFLIAKSKVGRRKNIIPIEVKSGKRYTTSSLDKFTNKFRTKVDCPVVLHPKDLKVADGVTYLPLYMTPLLG